MNAPDQALNVQAAFAGKRVLITGATGFLAKVVLEKLIRSVPEVGRVTLLIRAGEAGGARERFERQVATSSIFERLRAERPAFLEHFFASKLECITGEVTEPNFGLCPEAFAELAARLDVIVNAAASVDFREPLDRALAINTRSIAHVTALARAGGAALVQVSTCYVHGYQEGAILEQAGAPRAASPIPRHPGGWHQVEPLIAKLEDRIARVRAATRDPEQLERALTELGIREANRHGWNDTYTFTKWLGEQLAMQGMEKGSLTILRPSIIESTLFEPAPGWLEGVKVADAVILAYARGKTRFFPARPQGVIDVIPADLVANAILLAGAEALLDGPGRRIYQACSGSSNPIRVGELIELLQGEAQRNWEQYDKLFHTEPKHAFRVVGGLRFRAAMAALSLGMGLWSALRRLAGAAGESRAMEKLRTTRLLAITFSFYAQPRYVFHNDALLALAARFGKEGAALFAVDARLIDWEHYLCRVHMPGLNRYALRRKEAVAVAVAEAVAVAVASGTAAVHPKLAQLDTVR